MANLDLSSDGFHAFDFDPRRTAFHQYQSRLSSWPVPSENPSQHALNMRRSTTPLQTDGMPFQPPIGQQPAQQQPQMMRDWQTPQASSSAAFGYGLDTTAFPQQYSETYGVPFQTSPTDYLAPHSSLDTSLQMDASYLALQGQVDMAFTWQDLQHDLTGFTTAPGFGDMEFLQQSLPENSPTDTHLEVRSLTSASSDNGWASNDYAHSSTDASFADPQIGTIFNPGQTIHPRTFSDSSYSDVEQQSRGSWGSWVEVPNAISSPGTDSLGDMELQYDPSQRYDFEVERVSPPAISTSMVKPIAIKNSSSPQRSPASSGRSSPPSRRQSRKTPTAKSTKPVIRRQSQNNKGDTEKRIGRRRGPLRPEQRKQASEIRKLGACLRCKFLKKTCDKGEPCGGCKPAHARLWQVPCTRIDIRDIAYFMKDWRADFERHVSLGFSVGNIKGFSDKERTLWITHGYGGHVLPVKAREVFVRDESCFGLDWVETMEEQPSEHAVNTAKLSAAFEGISTTLLSEYLDRHLDGSFELFVDEYFEGTPFITQILKTAYRFWQREKIPVIRKALKLVLAYNLTQHVTMVEGVPEEEGFIGKILDETSRFKGKTVAPVMINFQVKCAMADMWRELQKDILEELSTLYSSVYTRDKLKHWPTIFMLASILLAVWEEMQFDCHYRVPVSRYLPHGCQL